jgi:hypothetical protein
MGAGLLEWMSRSYGSRYTSDVRLLIEEFGKSPNIEDVITEIGAEINALNGQDVATKFKREVLGNCRGRITEAIREWFREIHCQPSVAYTRFAAAIVRAGDVVVTFNYDDSLEKELRTAGKWDVSQGYGFRLGDSDQPSPVLVLKLHGSINWLVSILNGATSGPAFVGSKGLLGGAPVIHLADLDYLGYGAFSGRTYPGGGAFPALILPGRKKEFFYDTSHGPEFAEFWQNLWSQAVNALRQAEDIVLCGYSLLPVDERARELILQAPNKSARVTILSGSQSSRIAEDFRAAGFQSCGVFNGYFEHWVQERSAPELLALRVCS